MVGSDASNTMLISRNRRLRASDVFTNQLTMDLIRRIVATPPGTLVDDRTGIIRGSLALRSPTSGLG